MDHSGDDPGALAGRVGRRVAAYRRSRGLTSADVAERSGLSRTIVSRIEGGSGNPSIGTLWRLARALDVSLGDLIESGDPPHARVIRRGEGEAIGDPSGMVGRLLHGDRSPRRTEIFAIDLPAGAARASTPHASGVEELVIITAGRARVGPVGQEAELTTGDAIWFPADAAHGYAAEGGGPCALICCMLYPSELR